MELSEYDPDAIHVPEPRLFTPREYELPLFEFFDNGGKRAMIVWHRRAGKDLVCGHITAREMHKRPGMYWHTFPTAEQGRRSLWNAFLPDGRQKMETIFPRAIRRRPENWTPSAPMVVELTNGSLWQLLGTDFVDVVGAGPLGVVLSEYALQRPNGWELIRPMLRESGGWAILNTTPRGKNHAYQQYQSAKAEPGWFTQTLTALDTGLTYRSSNSDKMLSVREMLEEERRDGMPEELIRQEYLCDWSAALVGSYLGDCLEQLEARGGLQPFEADYSALYTSWDLGINDSTAIWVWCLNDMGGVDLVDYFEANGRPLSYFFDELEKRSKDKGYRYKKHWLPFDARNRHLTTGASVLEMSIKNFGSSMVAVAPELSPMDGIQAARWLLQGNTRFDAALCQLGLRALTDYRKEWDDEKKCFRNHPLHDWTSNAADAFRYLACVVRVTKMLSESVQTHRTAPAIRVRPDSRLNVTLNELWREREHRRR